VRDELFLETAVCSIYERLLQRCMAKFELWASRHLEICGAGSDEESEAELLRLQADYAKSYNDLCRHVGGCESCKLFPGTVHRNRASSQSVPSPCGLG
jgi:hypothetical protein